MSHLLKIKHVPNFCQMLRNKYPEKDTFIYVELE